MSDDESKNDWPVDQLSEELPKERGAGITESGTGVFTERRPEAFPPLMPLDWHEKIPDLPVMPTASGRSTSPDAPETEEIAYPDALPPRQYAPPPLITPDAQDLTPPDTTAPDIQPPAQYAPPLFVAPTAQEMSPPDITQPSPYSPPPFIAPPAQFAPSPVVVPSAQYAPPPGADPAGSLNFYSAPSARETPTTPSYQRGGEVQRVADAITAEVHKAVVGQDDAIENALAALFADGHILLEGVPGTAKTLLVRAIAAAISSDFKRIQFTPDLMPSDITGTRIFDQKAMEFIFKPGPIFTGLLLADEINRTPPKTQAGLLEAMQEHRVTIDGESHDLPDIFMVFATQNPIEFEGTYPLPEAQLDRFLLKVLISYPSPEAEMTILKRYHAGFDANNLTSAGIVPVVDSATILRCRTVISTVRVEEAMFKYLTSLVFATREHRHLVLGAGPRASIALLQTSKALAAMRGRDFIIPDDIKSIAPAVLRHRLLLRPEAEIEGVTADRVIDGILQGLEVPR